MRLDEDDVVLEDGQEGARCGELHVRPGHVQHFL